MPAEGIAASGRETGVVNCSGTSLSRFNLAGSTCRVLLMATEEVLPTQDAEVNGKATANGKKLTAAEKRRLRRKQSKVTKAQQK